MRKIGIIAAVLIITVVLPTLIYRSRTIRAVTISNPTIAQTQQVSVRFPPSGVRWSASGNVVGTGTLVIPYLFSNRVSGSFSTNGATDYYESNAWVIFVPEGQPRGKIRASFHFSPW